MKPRRQVSRAAIDLIKRFEGYRRKAAQTPDGRWTLGYGHVLTAREGAEVSKEDAEALLLYDLIEVAHAVNELTLVPLNANQFDALCSFVFNIGTENYRSSAVLRRLNEGAALQAAASLEMWRKAEQGGERIVIDALVRRRAAEKLLFLTPADGWIPAPTPMLPPQVDLEPLAAGVFEDQPAEEPVRTEVPEAASASERAVAAVGARLQQILSEPELQTGPALRLTPAPQFDPDPEPPSQSDTAEAPHQDSPTLFDVAPREEPQSKPKPEPESEPKPEPVPQPVAQPVAAPPVVVRQEKVVLPPPAAPIDWVGLAAPIGLGVAGVLLVAAALFFGFYAQDAAPGVNPRAIGWVGGLAGISMLAFSAYLALRRLEGAEGP